MERPATPPKRPAPTAAASAERAALRNVNGQPSRKPARVEDEASVSSRIAALAESVVSRRALVDVGAAQRSAAQIEAIESHVRFLRELEAKEAVGVLSWDEILAKATALNIAKTKRSGRGALVEQIAEAIVAREDAAEEPVSESSEDEAEAPMPWLPAPTFQLTGCVVPPGCKLRVPHAADIPLPCGAVIVGPNDSRYELARRVAALEAHIAGRPFAAAPFRDEAALGAFDRVLRGAHEAGRAAARERSAALRRRTRDAARSLGSKLRRWRRRDVSRGTPSDRGALGAVDASLASSRFVASSGVVALRCVVDAAAEPGFVPPPGAVVYEASKFFPDDDLDAVGAALLDSAPGDVVWVGPSSDSWDVSLPENKDIGTPLIETSLEIIGRGQQPVEVTFDRGFAVRSACVRCSRLELRVGTYLANPDQGHVDVLSGGMLVLDGCDVRGVHGDRDEPPALVVRGGKISTERGRSALALRGPRAEAVVEGAELSVANGDYGAGVWVEVFDERPASVRVDETSKITVAPKRPVVAVHAGPVVAAAAASDPSGATAGGRLAVDLVAAWRARGARKHAKVSKAVAEAAKSFAVAAATLKRTAPGRAVSQHGAFSDEHADLVRTRYEGFEFYDSDIRSHPNEWRDDDDDDDDGDASEDVHFDVDPPAEVEKLAPALALADLELFADAKCAKHNCAFEAYAAKRPDGEPLCQIGCCTACAFEGEICCVRGHLLAPIRLAYNAGGDPRISYKNRAPDVWEAKLKCEVCGEHSLNLCGESCDAVTYDEWAENYKKALGPLVPREVMKWDGENGGAELQHLSLNLCKNGHFWGTVFRDDDPDDMCYDY